MFYDADREFNYRESQLMKRPVCSCCKDHIQDDECIELPDGRLFCNECERENAYDLWLEWGREMFVRGIDT